MIRKVLLALLLFSFSYSGAEVYTMNILGHQYEDSCRNNVEPVYQQVLSSCSLLNDKKIPEKGVPKPRKEENKTGVFFISILLLFVFAGVRLMFSHQFAGSLDMLKNMNHKRKAQTETDNISLLSFYALFLITAGYMAYAYLTHYKAFFTHLPAIAGILVCIALVTFLFVIKIVFMYITAWAFDKRSQLSQYFLNVSIIYKLASIILFPLSILMLIASDNLSAFLLKAAIVLCALVMLSRYIRNIGLIKKLLTVHFLHFIMYLCAFEIIPLMILFKWMR